jgi:hypothetical protein
MARHEHDTSDSKDIELLASPSDNDTEGLKLIKNLKEFICEASVDMRVIPQKKFIVFQPALIKIRSIVKKKLGDNFLDTELTSDQFNKAVKLASTDVNLLILIEAFHAGLEKHEEMVSIVCNLFVNNEKLLVGQYQDDDFPAFFDTTPKCREFNEQMKACLNTPRLQQHFREAITMTGRHLGKSPLSEGNTNPVKIFLWLNPKITQFLYENSNATLINDLCEEYTDFCRASKIKILVSDPHMIVLLSKLLDKRWILALDDSKDEKEKNFRFAKQARELGETLTELLDSEQSLALQTILNCLATPLAQKTAQLTGFFKDNTEIADFICENQIPLLVLSGHYSVQVKKYYQSRNKHLLLPPDNPRSLKRHCVGLDPRNEVLEKTEPSPTK